MATLALSRDFLPQYARLEKPVRAKVDEVVNKFQVATHTGLHLEKINGQRDPRARTIRIDSYWRGVVIAPDQGDTYVLLRVMPHDDAIEWVKRNTFRVNQAVGALEVFDVVALENARETLEQAPPSEQGLFADRADKDFTKLGIPEDLVPVLRRLSTDEELLGLAMLLPENQAQALLLLAEGVSVEEAWASLVGGEDPGEVDPDDIDAALERPASKSMFYVVQGDDELYEMLNRPFDLWRTFLHPQQRRLAYREGYNGPVLVTGGAGTGKTVVAMHRAKALADRLGEAATGVGKPILFTTFTRNLAAAIAENLKLLGGPDLLDRVHVTNVDRFALQVVRDEEGTPPKVLRDEEEVWDRIVDELGTPYSAKFLLQEWHQVVLAQGISSRDAYFAAKRPGRGVRLARRDRAVVWKAIEAFTNRLLETGLRTHLQIAADAAGYLEKRTVKPYTHVIVDEAQDLHPAQWRALRAAAERGPDDMFIVGDTHQRIYDNRVSLKSVGIDVRGRSHKLRINYRTTHEILVWAIGLLTGERFDDLDEGSDTLRGYRSQLHGPAPETTGYTSRPAELEGLVTSVRRWIEDGQVDPSDIGVAARSADVLEPARVALRDAGIPTVVLGPDDDNSTNGAVELATMHRMKGLEYRCVAVIDAGRDRVPAPIAVTSEADDPVQHRHDLQRERCLLYVACTRARDLLRVSWSGQPSPFLEPLIQ